MQLLKFDDFAGQVGKNYEVLAGGNPLTVVLEQAQQLPGSAREGGGFRLVFRGPLMPVLPQATYPFRRGSGVKEIFIVPIAQQPNGIHYEALFL